MELFIVGPFFPFDKSSTWFYFPFFLTIGGHSLVSLCSTIINGSYYCFASFHYIYSTGVIVIVIVVVDQLLRLNQEVLYNGESCYFLKGPSIYSFLILI